MAVSLGLACVLSAGFSHADLDPPTFTNIAPSVPTGKLAVGTDELSSGKRQDAKGTQARVEGKSLHDRQCASQPKAGIVGPLQHPGAAAQGNRRQAAIEVRDAIADTLLIRMSYDLDHLDIE